MGSKVVVQVVRVKQVVAEALTSATWQRLGTRGGTRFREARFFLKKFKVLGF
ncbi:hypothetical protein ES332_A06G186800v1 [Gossypium tomentosum]|uniref:Uncharacterized protein n=1 Tax=Gossypium tomentosum TaxID=34277 RepID=A0A5D2Q5N8_GOSTO|nr:hypothetical protein ES332_A06G186800v1 [Gossypium tomentosum]